MSHVPLPLDTTVGKPRKRRRSTSTHRGYSFLIMLLPGLAFYLTFIVWPFINTVRFSFYNWSGLGPMTDFVGLQNYRNLFNKYPVNDQFANAFWNTMEVFVLRASLSTFVGLILAIILSRGLSGSRFYQAVFFLPNTLSVVVVGYLWNLLLNPQYGAVNSVLRAIGLDSWTQPWLGDSTFALPSIVAVGAWAHMGFPILLFLSAILGIPKDLMEAAKLDGASEMKTATSIVIPLIFPTILTLIVLDFIASINTFELIFSMSGAEGGPYYSTDVLGTLFYRMAFGGFGGVYSGIGLGGAAALAVLMLLIVMPVAAIIVIYQKRVSHEY